MEVQLAFAFTAGLVSTVNPCGFAMLPAYLAYFIGSEDSRADLGRAGVVLRGLQVGAVVSAGSSPSSAPPDWCSALVCRCSGR